MSGAEAPLGVHPAHRQSGAQVRFEWGPTGAEALALDCSVAVVVDVLSFSTTVSVAVERGLRVYPYRWRDDGAAAYAAQRGALLAVGRLEAREQPGQVSLSPAHLAEVDLGGHDAIVLPSPNGSEMSHRLLMSGLRVVAGCVRNAAAVAQWLVPQLAEGRSVAVIAAGERWPDGSLRPCVEDLWGAGAIISSLFTMTDTTNVSAEALVAAAAFEAVRGQLPTAMAGVVGAHELGQAGFAEDVAVASRLSVSDVVPVLRGEAFVAGL